MSRRARIEEEEEKIEIAFAENAFKAIADVSTATAIVSWQAIKVDDTEYRSWHTIGSRREWLCFSTAQQ
jgi:L-asparagine transporter-like permease